MSCSTSKMPRPRSATALVRISPKRSGLGTVEARGRLVEQQHVERPGEHPRQLDHPALPYRQQPGLEVGQRSDAGELDGVLDSPVHRRPLGRGTHQLTDGIGSGHRRLPAEGHVLPHGEGREQLDPLERAAESEAGPTGRPEGRDITPVQHDLSLLRLHQAGARVERGRLSCAVGADEARDASHGRGEAHVLTSPDAAVTDRQPTDLEPVGPGSTVVAPAVTRLSRRAASSSDAAACTRARRTCSSVTVCSGRRPPRRSRSWRTGSGTARRPAREDGIRRCGHTEDDLEVRGDVARREVARDDRHA